MCLPSLASLVLLSVFTLCKQTPHPRGVGVGRSQSANLCSRVSFLWPLNEPCAALISAWFPCSHACMSVAQSCPTLCDPLDHSAPGSSVPGILQARILGWVATSFSSIHLLEHKQKGNPPRWRHRARVWAGSIELNSVTELQNNEANSKPGFHFRVWVSLLCSRLGITVSFSKPFTLSLASWFCLSCF